MKRRRIRWIVFATLCAVVVAGLGAYFYRERFFPEPWQYLRQVADLEKARGVRQVTDPELLQHLGWYLSMLGRDDEVRRLNFHPQGRPSHSTVAGEDLKLNVVPWREGIRNIASRYRIVMIMEAHAVSKHREFIGATLPIFKDAGFTNYAAEAISEFDPSLVQRGYPNKRTGVYTADPKFGNVLRRAMDLKFAILGYDYRFSTHEEREEFAATRLAELFQNNADTKLLVHAGFSHVLKHETTNGQRWLAQILWNKTRIEPFTIWQWSSRIDAHDYENVMSELKARAVNLDEPVLLMPPPALDCGLQDSPYGLASVDAIVLHPPDESVAPAKRTVLFPDAMQRLTGHWTEKTWPIVISAYKKGEPNDAIPLDQVMLRQGESDFVLWVPDGTEYEMRVFNNRGTLKAKVDRHANLISVGM